MAACITREELLAQLRSGLCEDCDDEAEDPEDWHAKADEALLAYIGDDEVSRAFLGIDKWYA